MKRSPSGQKEDLSADLLEGSGKARAEIRREVRLRAPRNQSSAVNLPDSPERIDLRCKSVCLSCRSAFRYGLLARGFRRGTAGGMLALARCDGWKNSMTRAARQMRRLTPPRPLAPRPPKAPEAGSRRPVVSSARRPRKAAGAASPAGRRDDKMTRRRAIAPRPPKAAEAGSRRPVVSSARRPPSPVVTSSRQKSFA